jgi:cyanate lyase
MGEAGMAKREEVLAKVLEAKQASGLGWKELAAKISSGSPIVTTAALLGQMTLTSEEAAVAAELFSLTTSEAALLTKPPYRGSLPAGPPTDPLLYRFYELLQVYGTTWKALIEEEFGDGIMSAIDFSMALEREADPKGDRVKITMSGKFLPYKR